MGSVAVAKDGAVATITLCDTETRNALDQNTVDQLSDACSDINADESIGAVVITGAGKAFCSGLSRDLLDELKDDPLSAASYSLTSAVYDAILGVGGLSVPSVAAVEGPAVGAGLNLFMATDLRIVAEDARLISGFFSGGIHPGGGHFAATGRLAMWETVSAMGVFGQEVSGLRAAQLGIAWMAVAPGDALDQARQIAQHAASDPELARQVILSFRTEMEGGRMPWRDAMELERGRQLWSFARTRPSQRPTHTIPEAGDTCTPP